MGLPFLQKSQGFSGRSSDEVPELLVETHFTASQEDSELKPCLEGMKPQMGKMIKLIIAEDQIG